MSVPSRLGSPPEADSCPLHHFHQLHLFQERPSFSALRTIENIEKPEKSSIFFRFSDFQQGPEWWSSNDQLPYFAASRNAATRRRLSVGDAACVAVNTSPSKICVNLCKSVDEPSSRPAPDQCSFPFH